MKENGFQHWHIHFESSRFDGMITVDEAEEDLLAYDKPAYAITDHGAMPSIIALNSICVKHKKKLVPGSEIYVVNDLEEKLDCPRGEKINKKRHLVLLAKNETGFQNLIYLNSLASMYFYMKPRVDHDYVFEKSEGLIATTACLGGVIAYPLLWDDSATEQERQKNAEEIAFRYREAFGDDFYLEIQPVDKKEQLILNSFMINLHKKHGFNLIATNDAHYAKKDHYVFHAHLIAVQNRSQDSDNELVYKPGHHLRNLDEMREAFIANGTTKEYPIEVEHAIQTANQLDQKIEGVKISKNLKVPEYRESNI